MKTIPMLMIAVAVLSLTNCKKNSPTDPTSGVTEERAASDVAFARQVFEDLAKGDLQVAEKIDWPVFTVMGKNLGATYVSISSGVEKKTFTDGFISQFATNFRETGGSLEAFKNWRSTLRNELQTEVGADSDRGVLTMVITDRDGVKRVVSIDIVK